MLILVFTVHFLTLLGSGFMYSILEERGYTPEGLLNYVALLGWSPKTDKEIFTLQELIDNFSLEGIGK